MSKFFRLCPACRQEVALEANRCLHCGQDTQCDFLPAPRVTALQKFRSALPAIVAGSLIAVRIGIAVFRHPWVRGWLSARHANALDYGSSLTDRTRQGPARVRIRARWRVQGPRGIRQQGQEERTIECL